MNQPSLLQNYNGIVSAQGDSKEEKGNDESMHGPAQGGEQLKDVSWTGPVSHTELATEKEGNRTTGSHASPLPWQNLLGQRSGMTIAEFIERKFVPERVSLMRYAGRTHYQAMLKHVLHPEEVDRLFQVDSARSKGKLKALPDWPYLHNVLMRDAQPEHIERLAAAASERGYSLQTVTHIRNVVAAIFSYAKKEDCFLGDNPASRVRLSRVASPKTGVLTMAQAKEAIRVMKYPEREMSLFTICTDMNVAEICGLQWKYVNLTEQGILVDGEPIPPRSIAVRKQWYRSVLGNVAISRVRNQPVTDLMLQILLGIRSKSKFICPENFVLTSRFGTPVNETNTVARRLKPLALRLRVPSLSWQVFHRTRKTLIAEFGVKFEDITGMFFASLVPGETDTHREWHCRTPWPRAHSHES
jgi:integrase